MKTIDELGISNTPWIANIAYGEVRSADSDAVANCNDLCVARLKEADANARLIAAAPELYEALRDAVDIACARCQTANAVNCDIENNPCHSCLPSKWREVLAKAAKESEAK